MGRATKGGAFAAIDAAKDAERRSDFEAARASMSEALDRAPNTAKLHALMGWYTARCRSLPDADRDRLADHHLGVAREIDPKDPAVAYCTGLVAALRGNNQRARLELGEAVKLRPDFAEAKQALAELGRPTAPITVERPTPRRRGRGRVFALVVTTAGLAAFAGWFHFGGSDSLAAMARDLGTRMKLLSMAKIEQELHLGVGDGWTSLSDGERTEEASTLSAGGKRLGFSRIYLYSSTPTTGGDLPAPEGATVTIVPPDEHSE